MPLIEIVGGPCAGKTTIASEIKDYLEKVNFKVVQINEESLGLDRNFYADAQSEKIIRATFRSETEKSLSDTQVVILDTMNYIKGFRYELHCLVRQYKTRHVIVNIKTPLEKCLEFNVEGKYSDELLKDLYSRMEEPNGKSE